MLLSLIVIFPKIPVLSSGFATPIRIEDFAIAYLWILFMIYALAGKIKIRPNELFFWIALYIFFGFLSTAMGFIRGDVPTFFFFLRKLEYISLFIFAYVIIGKKDMPKIYNFVFFSFWIIAFVGFLQYFKVLEYLGIVQKFIPYLQSANQRFWGGGATLVSSVFDGNYDLGGYLILMVPFFLLLLFERQYFHKKKIFVFLLVAIVLALLSGARTPIIIIAAAISFVLVKKLTSIRAKQALKSFFVIIFLFLFLFSFPASIFQNISFRIANLQSLDYAGIFEFVKTDKSVLFRSEKWSLIWENFVDYPIFGIGIGGFSDHFIGADGQHIQTLGETGLIGAVLFLILFFSIIKMNFRTGKYLDKTAFYKTKSLDRAFVAALSIGIIGLMLDGIMINIFDSSKVAMYMWAFVGVAAKLNVLSKYQYQNDQRDSSKLERAKIS